MSQGLAFAPLLPYWDQFLLGAALTLRLSVSAMMIGTLVAILGAWTRIYGPRPLATAVGVYVEAIRNTPLLIQIYLVFFGLPGAGLRLSADEAALVALTLNVSAYAIEIVRAGIESIARGQIEAGRALGLHRRQVFLLVVLRPALRNIFPALASQFIILMLYSSLISVISANDLSSVANHVQSVTFRSFEVYIVSTALYFALAMGLSFTFGAIFRRFVDYPTR
jgi:polar amino acid transport system permease protein